MSDSHTLRLSLQNMSCASCVGRVDKALAAIIPTLQPSHLELVRDSSPDRREKGKRPQQPIGKP